MSNLINSKDLKSKIRFPWLPKLKVQDLEIQEFNNKPPKYFFPFFYSQSKGFQLGPWVESG